MRWRLTSLLLNVAHAIDHLMLLVFATAVSAIARDFGISRWEDLMPYTTVAFLLFGVGSLPAGRLGDLWGRRAMMLVFFFGMGASTLLIALTQNAWQLAIALGVMGAFSSIYHPVGIPMLLRHTSRPGITIGINGMAGNLGIAAAGVNAEQLLVALSDVALSTGSACASGSAEPSHVLAALGLPEAVARSSLRFGIGRSNDIEQIEWVAGRLVEAVAALRG